MDFLVEHGENVGTFMWAVKAMKEGKKVRRGGVHSWHLELKGMETIVIADKPIANDKLYYTDYLATDWEIYEEKEKWTPKQEQRLLDIMKKKIDKATPKEIDECVKFLANWEKEEDNWNLADEVYGKSPLFKETIISVENIKTFIQKVKEDVNKYIKPDFYDGDIPIISKTRINEIIDKRAGGL